ncbi:MAG: LON peptidase substrate-binding domain-containing protein [Acidimicrobiales bacterium]
MFPLGNVLFPGLPMVLHVFEPRYRVMTRQCLDTDRLMGVVLIERGSEVGGGDIRAMVATEAAIVDAVEFADGRFGLGLVGRHRVRVREWLPDDPFPLARVEVLSDAPSSASPALGPESATQESLTRTLRRVLALRSELGESTVPATVELDPDPVAAVWQAAALGGLGPADAQRLLTDDQPQRRRDWLAGWLSEEAAVLAHRLGGG